MVWTSVHRTGRDVLRWRQNQGGALWPAETFPAAEHHPVRARVGQPLEILQRWHFRSGVDDDRHLMGMRNLDDLGQAQRKVERPLRVRVEDSRGVIIDRLFELPALTAPAAADLDELDADLTNGVIVAVAMR